MQFLGADINITGQDIVHDDILDEGAPVMLFFVEDLGVIQGDIGHGAEGFGQLVLTGAEHGVLIQIGAAHNGLEAFLGKTVMPSTPPPIRRAASGQRSPSKETSVQDTTQPSVSMTPKVLSEISFNCTITL